MKAFSTSHHVNVLVHLATYLAQTPCMRPKSPRHQACLAPTMLGKAGLGKQAMNQNRRCVCVFVSMCVCVCVTACVCDCVRGYLYLTLARLTVARL